MLKLPSGMKDKPMWKTLGPKGQIGFWLPIEAGYFPEENMGKSSLLIWMEYSIDNNSFLGSLAMGAEYHVEALRVRRNKGEWHVDDDRSDAFLGAMTDGNDPQTFRIGGFSGEWVLVISPFT